MQERTIEKRWLSPNDLLEEFGFSLNNQAKLRSQRKIPFSKMGNYIKYDRLEINKWFESNKIDIRA